MEPSSSKEAASESFLPDGVIEVRHGDLGSCIRCQLGPGPPPSALGSLPALSPALPQATNYLVWGCRRWPAACSAPTF